MKVFFSLLSILFFVLLSGAQNAYIRSYGMAGAFNEGKGIIAFPDSTYLLLGNRLTTGGQSSAWLFKVDSVGAIIWEKYFSSYELSTSNNLAQHDDTSVIVTGTVIQGADYSMFAARVSTSGNILWEKTYGTAAWDQGLCSTSDTAGNVWLCGYASAIDTLGQDILVYKLDGGNGDSLFAKRIDDGFNDQGVYIDTAINNHIILASQSRNSASEMVHSRIWYFDNNLDTVWTFVPGYGEASVRTVECAFQDTFKRIIYCGELLPDTGTVNRFWYGCVSSAGYFAWELVQPPFYMKNIRRGIVNDLNEFYFTGGIFPYYFGFGNSDVGLWVDKVGLWQYYYYGALQEEEGTDLDFAPDGGMVFIGTTKSFGPGVTNILLVKLGPGLVFNDTDVQHYTPVESYSTSDTKVFPNPSDGVFQVTFSGNDSRLINVFDLQGNLVYEATHYSGESVILSEVSDGMYLVRVTSALQSDIFRLFLQKN